MGVGSSSCREGELGGGNLLSSGSSSGGVTESDSSMYFVELICGDLSIIACSAMTYVNMSKIMQSSLCVIKMNMWDKTYYFRLLACD